MQVELDNPEDAKIVTLARSARARTRATEGAAVRDTDGRTYAAATVALPSLHISAVGVAVAMAVSSGSKGLEAVAMVGETRTLTSEDLAVIRDFGGEGVTVLIADAGGQVQSLDRS
jgi:hypothetical protein